MPSEILDLLAPQFDAIVETIYRAGSGLEPWLTPISRVADVFDAWAVQLLGVNKLTGLMTFSFEAGRAPAAASVEHISHYHRVESRRDDEPISVLLGHFGKLGRAPLNPEEKEAFGQLAGHFGRALDMQAALEQRAPQHSVGAELLSRMRQPMMLVDHQRRVSYRNANAAELLRRGDLIFDMDGALACRDPESDHELTIALRDLALVPVSTLGDVAAPVDRRSFRLRRREGANVAATLLALRPEATLGSFGRAPQALFTLFEPGASVNIDPFLLATTFDLTPAEARIAAMIVNGHSTEECARELHVKMSTVRSQLLSVFAKTGATGQADLVRLILSATTL